MHGRHSSHCDWSKLRLPTVRPSPGLVALKGVETEGIKGDDDVELDVLGCWVDIIIRDKL